MSEDEPTDGEVYTALIQGIEREREKLRIKAQENPEQYSAIKTNCPDCGEEMTGGELVTHREEGCTEDGEQ